MAAVVCVAVAWATYTITKSNADIDQLNQTAARIEREAERLLAQRDEARQDAQRARLAGAEATGKLAAYQEHAQLMSNQSDNRPTTRPSTRPSNVIQRLADAMAGE